MKKMILTALAIVSTATVAMAGDVPASSLIKAENVSLVLLRERCSQLADKTPDYRYEDSFLGITYQGQITPNSEENYKRCTAGVEKFSEVIGELTGAITVDDVREALKQRTVVTTVEELVSKFEALALENYRLCTAYALVESDAGFLGFHSRVERCRDGAKELGEVHKGYRKAVEFDKKRGVK